MTDPAYYSQFGEDRLLHELFKGKVTGCCVEVGGNDGVLNSNSCHFEQLGWKALLVEPIPALCLAIRARRPAAMVIECAASDRMGDCKFHIAVGVDGMSTMSDDINQLRTIEREGGRIETVTVRTRTLDDILAGAGFTEIDFMTIDVEGAEKQVLAGLSLEQWHPRILIIEDNSQGWDKWLCSYLGERGYVNFHRTGVNDWFAAAGDGEILGRFDLPRYQRMRAWLPWRHRVGRIAKRTVPAILRSKLKKWFGELPFSGPDAT